MGPDRTGPSSIRRRALVGLCAALALVASAAEAQAHAFGARYDLPLPLNLYLAGAGAAVALSFVIMVLVFRGQPIERAAPWTDLTVFKPVRALIHPVVVGTGGTVAVGLFIMVLAAGFFGTQETVKNFAPTFVWIIWWVGFAYLAALVGNLWLVLNPWSIIFGEVERAVARLGHGRPLGLNLDYPSWAGAWPAVVLFGCFAWFELISENAKIPADLAMAVVVYSVVTWLGMWVFGRRIWLARAEPFSIAFDVFGRFAPLGGRGLDDAAEDGRRRLYLRPYAGGLVASKPCGLSMTAFVVLMLATVSFDGLKETPFWGDVLGALATSPLLYPMIRGIHDLGFDLHMVLETVVFILFPLVFLLVYLGFAWLTRLAAGDRRPVTEIAGLFVYSLVPIAIAYHLAHYLSYLVLAGQFIIPLASDPFGFGWDLLGTADYELDIGLIGAKFVWYMAVISIVAGHVFAVGVAHFTALKVFKDQGRARRSQYPMLVLMVGYTVVSLWLLSQPIVGGRDVSKLHATSDTVTLAPFQYRERCYPMTAGAELGYGFRADKPVTFNIHYHGGLKVHFPVAITGTRIPDSKFTATGTRNYCLMWVNESLSTISFSYRIVGPR